MALKSVGRDWSSVLYSGLANSKPKLVSAEGGLAPRSPLARVFLNRVSDPVPLDTSNITLCRAIRHFHAMNSRAPDEN